MSKAISPKQIQQYQRDLTQHPQAIANAVQQVGPFAASHQPFCDPDQPQAFSLTVPTKNVTNQLHSGRCWLFAQLNTMRHFAAQKANLDDVEFSQSYLAFFDRLEKANCFLEQIITTAEQPLSSRLVAFYLRQPDGDGGQYDNAAALVEKYGLVPKSAMPETFTSSNTKDFNALLNARLRKAANQLRQAAPAAREDLKQQVLAEVYRMLSYAYGKVPATFDFEYRDKNQQYHRDANLTPQSFYQKYVGWALRDYVTILSTPAKPYWHSYSFPDQDYVIDGRPIKFVNVPFDVMEKLAIAQLQAGEAVWFGNDVTRDMDRDSGTLLGGLYDLNTLFDVDLIMDKKARFLTGEAVVSHAMTLTGVDLVDNQPTYWQVENSWGKDRGHNGFYTADEAWFQAYTYECVIRRDLLDEKTLQAVATIPQSLQAWDALR